jgi:hypothetical protein
LNHAQFYQIMEPHCSACIYQDESEDVPNHQLEASVEDLKVAQLTGLTPGNDDINIKSNYGGRRRGERVVVASPEPSRGQAAGWPVSGMVRVQMEESGEILDVESKYLEEVSPVFFTRMFRFYLYRIPHHLKSLAPELRYDVWHSISRA